MSSGWKQWQIFSKHQRSKALGYMGNNCRNSTSAFFLGVPWTSAGPRTRAGAPPWTLSSVRGAENNRAPQYPAEMSCTSSNIGKENLGIHLTANQTSLQLISFLFHFFFFFLKPQHRHPNCRDQEGADVGCWNKAQYGLTGEMNEPQSNALTSSCLLSYHAQCAVDRRILREKKPKTVA